MLQYTPVYLSQDHMYTIKIVGTGTQEGIKITTRKGAICRLTKLTASVLTEERFHWTMYMYLT
jgi:hypothetical protein